MPDSIANIIPDSLPYSMVDILDTDDETGNNFGNPAVHWNGPGSQLCQCIINVLEKLSQLQSVETTTFQNAFANLSVLNETMNIDGTVQNRDTTVMKYLIACAQSVLKLWKLIEGAFKLAIM